MLEHLRGRRYVASAMSRGRTASTPWAMKNGEKLIHWQIVTWSAQRMRGAMLTHFECSLLHVFMRDSLMSKCLCSTMPLAWELYGDILIWCILYFLERYPGFHYEHRTIISDDFCNSTPPAEDILKYKVAKGLLIFLPKWVPLGPR